MLKSLPPMRAIEMANDGEIDGEVARIADVARRYSQLEPLTTPFSTIQLVIYALTPDIESRTRAELRRQRFGILRGVYIAAKSTAGLTVVEASGPDALFGLLRDRRIDVIVLEPVAAAAYLRDHPQPGLHRWPHAWASEPLYTVINKKHTALLPRLNAAAAQMQRDGVVDRLNDDALASVRGEPLLPEPPAR